MCQNGLVPMMFIIRGKIVGEHVESDLGGDLAQTPRQEVRRARPHLQRVEGMLGGLATLAHGVRFLSRRLCTALGRSSSLLIPGM